MNRFVTRDWTFKSVEPTGTIALSVVVNLDVLNDNVVASAVGPERAATLRGRLRREKYTNGNGRISTRYVVTFDGRTLTAPSRKDVLDMAGTAAIHAAMGR